MNDLAVVEAGASEHSAKSVLQAVEFFFGRYDLYTVKGPSLNYVGIWIHVLIAQIKM